MRVELKGKIQRVLQCTLQSESVAANCPSNKAASLWLSEQQELRKRVNLRNCERK
jgi:hypothetical protein